tara:strand:+ start:685 stop:1170 length:486 start_codon:yes stop_codon:yes gene_type:complete
MKKKGFLTEAKRKAIIADKEKAIIESFAKTFNRIKRIDENDSIDDIYAEWYDKNIFGIHPKGAGHPDPPIAMYKVNYNVDVHISPYEPATLEYPGHAGGLDGVDPNLDGKAIRLDDSGKELGMVDLPKNHYEAIADAIEKEYEYKYEDGDLDDDDEPWSTN